MIILTHKEFTQPQTWAGSENLSAITIHLLAVKTIALLVDDFPSIKLIMSGADRGDGSLAETMETN